jgi:hypothetical protein
MRGGQRAPRRRRRSVKPAGVAADLAMGDSAGRVDGEIAGAAVRAAVGSGGGGGSAPKAAHCDGPARDRRGRGSRMHSVPLVARPAGACLALDTASRLVLLHGPTIRKDRSGAWFPCPERCRERVGLDRRFASADHGIIVDRGRFVKRPIRRPLQPKVCRISTDPQKPLRHCALAPPQHVPDGTWQDGLLMDLLVAELRD